MAGQLTDDWLGAQLAGAPPELVRRTLELARATGERVEPGSLARAGRRALAAAVAKAPDRGAALDLLAADALVTLALAAQAELDPGGLEQFAVALRSELEAAGE